jgi:sugar lactone lactonase YvrE
VGSGDTTADKVFGQGGSFASTTCNLAGVTDNSLCNPAGVAVDRSGNLYVTDSSNNRALEYNTTPLTTNTTADRVFGQSVFTANLCNKGGAPSNTTLCSPLGVAVDSGGNLYVGDYGNNRVLEYTTPLTTNTTADKVFGQFGSFVNNFCDNTNAGLQPPISSQSLCGPSGVAVDSSNNLYVDDSINNRFLEYNTPLTLDVTADGVLGQQLFTTGFANFVDGRGFNFSDFGSLGRVAIDTSVSPNRVYVADHDNHRVLAWNDVAAFVSHAAAILVFGQASPYEKDCNRGAGTPSAISLCGPQGVDVDSAGNLYVADTLNSRVLEYNTPFTSGTTADKVFGQAGSFTSTTCNLAGETKDTLCLPMGVAADGAGNLYVADTSNNRVLEYNTPLTTDTSADKVFGQGNVFTTNVCNKGEVTSANTLCQPAEVTTDGAGNLYVADTGNSRVLEYTTPLTTNTTADRVFGQNNLFTTNVCNVGGVITARTACNPSGVAVDSLNNLYVSDAGNARVLKYTTPLTTDTTADRVFGQGNQFTINGCKPISPNTLCGPDGVAVDSANNLYVVDTNYNRVLKFVTP